MRLLELCSRTQSVGKIAESLGYGFTCLELENADMNTDISNWDYITHKPEHFNVLWMSPPCTVYSRAETTGARNLTLANEIAMKTLEIIEYGFVKKSIFYVWSTC